MILSRIDTHADWTAFWSRLMAEQYATRESSMTTAIHPADALGVYATYDHVKQLVQRHGWTPALTGALHALADQWDRAADRIDHHADTAVMERLKRNDPGWLAPSPELDAKMALALRHRAAGLRGAISTLLPLTT